MIRRLLLALLLLLTTAPAAAQKVSAGTIIDLGIVQSKYTDPRKVVVWLPSGYRAHGPRYAVLYMHDGQNLFDKATASYGMEWQVDETLDRLIRENKVRPTIVVGIWNTPKRLQEYLPSKAFAALPPAYIDRVRKLYGGEPLGDGYLKFIVKELKPRIDREFNVRRDRTNTVIMGSSMGALISLYAVTEYPRVFGGGGIMSTHWPIMSPGYEGLEPAAFDAVAGSFETYLKTELPMPGGHRLYFDDGAERLDPQYAMYQARIERLIALTGYRAGMDMISRNFPDQKHNEISWASRLEFPLRFLLPPVHRRARAK